MQSQLATAEFARNSRTRPRRIELPVADFDLPIGQSARPRMLLRGAARLRCRLPFLRCRHDRECDGSKVVALRAPGSWREWLRL